MPRKARNEEALEILSAEYQTDHEPDSAVELAKECAIKYDAGWRPRHTTTQRAAYEDKTSKWILLDGERATGKSCVALNMLIDHAFNNRNAVCAILVKEASMAKDGGAWDKLINRNFLIWKDGNFENERSGNGVRCDKGIGLVTSKPSHDMDTKKAFVWILNRFGGWSRVVCISMPVGAHVRDKIKGREYSFIFVDEAQTTESDDYFTEVVQQVGRATGISWTQQVVYACNPKGPSHWLYNRFFVIPWNEDEQSWNQDYARYHIPIEENIDNLPPGYYDNVIEACKNNPILFARNVRGEWIDIPEGDAIFKDTFFVNIHTRGDAKGNIGLNPIPNFPIITGWDLGVRNSSLHFMQSIPLTDRILWIVFDELNYVGTYIPYPHLVPKILSRMDYWDKFNGPYQYIHISDDSAFNQVRPDGSVDVKMVESLSNGRIKLIAAPKGKESRPGRVHMLMDMFVTEQIIISATCPKTIDMCNYLEAEHKKDYDENQGFVPKKGPYVHVIDSLTYPPYYYQSKGLMGSVRTSTVKTSSVIYCGGR